MRCRTCKCELIGKNPPVAALDLGAEFSDGAKYFCGSQCLVKWIMKFAVVRFGEKQANAMLHDAIVEQ